MYIACMFIFQTQIQNILVTQVKPNSNDNFFEPDPSSVLLHVLVKILAPSAGVPLADDETNHGVQIVYKHLDIQINAKYKIYSALLTCLARKENISIIGFSSSIQQLSGASTQSIDRSAMSHRSVGSTSVHHAGHATAPLRGRRAVERGCPLRCNSSAGCSCGAAAGGEATSRTDHGQLAAPAPRPPPNYGAGATPRRVKKVRVRHVRMVPAAAALRGRGVACR
jgi:hypothetical protein